MLPNSVRYTSGWCMKGTNMSGLRVWKECGIGQLRKSLHMTHLFANYQTAYTFFIVSCVV